MEKFITIRARAFNGNLETINCCVDDDGDVTVFDSLAGHYSRSHSLSSRDLGRILAVARRQEEPGKCAVPSAYGNRAYRVI